MEKADFIAIKDIRDRMKNINVMFIVLEVTASTKTKEGRDVYSFKVSDSTGCVNCSIWDEPGKLLQPGDIVRMMKCYAAIFRNCLTLYSGKTGEISRVGDFCLIFNEQLNMSEPVTMSQSPALPPAVIPPSSVNGNGNGRGQTQNTSSTSVTSSSNSTNPETKTKISTGNTNRNFSRKPINKK